MRAIQVVRYGETPELRKVAQPQPGPGEVAIQVAACGLNFADLLLGDGTYQERPPLPVTLGMEFAGTVAATGADVTGLGPGDRVAVFAGHGGLADTAIVPANRVLRLSGGMPFDHAAAFQVAYGTSHVALVRRAHLAPGETLLVLGAAGGVGLTAVELGRLLGARVLAVARGPQKLAAAKEAGADEVFDAGAPGLAEALRQAGGVDVVYDPVGGDLYAPALRACRPEARYLLIGFAGGVPEVRANHLMVKNLALLGFYWGGYLAFRPEVVRGSLEELFGWYAEGLLRPQIGRRLPLEQAVEGLGLLRRRAVSGKIVVEVAP